MMTILRKVSVARGLAASRIPRSTSPLISIADRLALCFYTVLLQVSPDDKSLKADPLHLFQADIVASTLVQFAGSCRRVVRDRRGVLSVPPFFTYAVMPVARNVSWPIFVAILAQSARGPLRRTN